MICRNVDPLHPSSAKWYELRWPQTFLGTGTTISTSDWTVPAGLTEESAAATGLATRVLLSAATGYATGTAYDVVNVITTSNGMTLNETIRLYVSEDGH